MEEPRLGQCVSGSVSRDIGAEHPDVAVWVAGNPSHSPPSGQAAPAPTLRTELRAMFSRCFLMRRFAVRRSRQHGGNETNRRRCARGERRRRKPRLVGPVFRSVPRRGRSTSGSSYSPNVRVYFAVLILAATVSACSSGNGGRRAETPSGVQASSSTNRRVERCVDRLLQHGRAQDLHNKELARRYVRRTYCARFEGEGWVYEDGALSIAAQTWLEHGGTCATSSAGEPAKTVPCEPERRGGVRIIECALLRVIRRSEVRDYIEQLRTEGPIECDDGTAIAELGVP